MAAYRREDGLVMHLWSDCLYPGSAAGQLVTSMGKLYLLAFNFTCH